MKKHVSENNKKKKRDTLSPTQINCKNFSFNVKVIYTLCLSQLATDLRAGIFKELIISYDQTYLNICRPAPLEQRFVG